MTGIFRCLWAGTCTAAPVGGSVECHPAVLFRQDYLRGRRGCKHSAVNVIMRDGYTVQATMVAHDRISMSIVTQVQAEHLKRHEFTNMRKHLP